MTQQAITPPPIYYVSFSAEINANTTESLLALMAQIATLGSPEVYLMISTPGGEVMRGMNLYNVLRGMPFTLTTHNVGNIDSIGNAIFLAGEHRYASPHSTFMFHGVAIPVSAGILEQKWLRERLDGIIADEKRIGAVLTDRTTLTEAETTALFIEAQTKDATYAIGKGIIHEIRDIQIPAGAPIATLTFERKG